MGATVPRLTDLVDPEREAGQDWGGRARMAAARQGAGLPLDALDVKALRMSGLGADRIVEDAFPRPPASLAAGLARRDRALDDVEDHADPDWLNRAKAALRKIAESSEELTGDDLWRVVEKPAEPRASGAVFRWAATAGIIAATDRFRPTTQATSHASPSRVWRSLITCQD